MSAEPTDLFGKTYDQQLETAGNMVETSDITPNLRISGEIVFEPVLNGVRVTARDTHHRILWGFIGSKDMINQIHCPVAVYETLQDILGEQLEKHGLPKKETQEPIHAAERALTSLQNALDNLKTSLDVKKISDATRERAKVIARIASDAERSISLEISNLLGVREKFKHKDEEE